MFKLDPDGILAFGLMVLGVVVGVLLVEYFRDPEIVIRLPGLQ